GHQRVEACAGRGVHVEDFKPVLRLPAIAAQMEKRSLVQSDRGGRVTADVVDDAVVGGNASSNHDRPGECNQFPQLEICYVLTGCGQRNVVHDYSTRSMRPSP